MIEGIEYIAYNEQEKVEETLHHDAYEKQLCSLAEELFQEAQKRGAGKSAEVFRDFKKNGLCYKVVRDQGELIRNVDEEAEFLNELSSVDHVVRVPEPIVSIIAHTAKDLNGKIIRKKEFILVMEEIKGPSIKDIFDSKGSMPIPKNFNPELFFDHLLDFVEHHMHARDIYHRDLHEGNVMIDEITGEPVVIDFGLSMKKYLTDEDPYKTEPNSFGEVFAFKNDIKQIAILKDNMSEYLTNYTK